MRLVCLMKMNNFTEAEKQFPAAMEVISALHQLHIDCNSEERFLLRSYASMLRGLGREKEAGQFEAKIDKLQFESDTDFLNTQTPCKATRPTTSSRPGTTACTVNRC